MSLLIQDYKLSIMEPNKGKYQVAVIQKKVMMISDI